MRAAACRALGVLAPALSRPLLLPALQDQDLAVRAEAAIALATDAQFTPHARVLWECVATQAGIHGRATGWYRMQAERRLQRWTRYLAWLVPLGHADLPALFDYLPPRVRLNFALYHGDGAHLDRVSKELLDPETARYAGWVWQTLTGVDLQSAGLVLAEPPPAGVGGPLTDARRDADDGLPLPDAAAIARYSVRLTGGKRSLLGRELVPTDAVALLRDAPQALRAIAAHALHMMLRASAANVRASADVQRAQLAALHAAYAA